MTQPYARPSINQASAMMKIDDKHNKHLWIFAYGSLMWRPGFSYLERVPARLVGLHRALCVFSFVHRGTPERPGLVLGLDRGGMCRGIAYRVAAASRADTLQYLRSREQVTSVYVETVRQIQLADHAARRVRAVCYIVDRSHVQYAGRLNLAKSLHHVRQGHGRSGANRDYVLETVRALEALGYRESDLHLLAERLKSQGSGIGHQAPGISHQASGKQQQRTGDQTSEMSVLDP
jgi:glutathione-specific gamma-glutamylcyclotransferase